MKLGKHLLEEFGEFYPFAYGITADGLVVSVATYFEEEHPKVDELIEHLRKALLKSDEQHHFEFASVCRDVLFTPDGDTEKQDALEIKVSSRNAGDLDVFACYTLQNANLIFNEVYQDSGDFKLFATD